jgi:hypothetical protein
LREGLRPRTTKAWLEVLSPAVELSFSLVAVGKSIDEDLDSRITVDLLRNMFKGQIETSKSTGVKTYRVPPSYCRKRLRLSRDGTAIRSQSSVATKTLSAFFRDMLAELDEVLSGLFDDFAVRSARVGGSGSVYCQRSRAVRRSRQYSLQSAQFVRSGRGCFSVEDNILTREKLSTTELPVKLTAFTPET